MAEAREMEFVILRYAPRADEEKAVNIGVILVEPRGAKFSGVRFITDWQKVLAVDPSADLELLQAFAREMEETPDHQMKLKAMENSFSNAIQLSPRESRLTTDPEKEIEQLALLYL